MKKKTQRLFGTYFSRIFYEENVFLVTHQGKDEVISESRMHTLKTKSNNSPVLFLHYGRRSRQRKESNSCSCAVNKHKGAQCQIKPVHEPYLFPCS